MRGDVLSASMRIANRRVRLSSGMFRPPLFGPLPPWFVLPFRLATYHSRSVRYGDLDLRVNSADPLPSFRFRAPEQKAPRPFREFGSMSGGKKRRSGAVLCARIWLRS